MSFYKIDTVFDFGKYKGKTLKQIFIINPSYLDWCLRTVCFFSINEKVFKNLKDVNPSYTFSNDATQSVSSDKTVTQRQNMCQHYNDNSQSGYNLYMRDRLNNHPELRDRPDHEAIRLIELADDIGCEPEDLVNNLDM